MSGCTLTDAGVQSLAALTRLQHLDASDNAHITDVRSLATLTRPNLETSCDVLISACFHYFHRLQREAAAIAAIAVIVARELGIDDMR